MSSNVLMNVYDVKAGEFQTAGDASASIKRKLKQIGVDSSVLRRIAVASYEAELNLIIHSEGGQLKLAMSPDVIAADEIGSEEDAYAIAEAARMGVKVIASAHAASVQDALNRPMIAEILASGAFQYACVLGQSPGHILKVHAFSEGKWLQTSLSESL